MINGREMLNFDCCSSGFLQTLLACSRIAFSFRLFLYGLRLGWVRSMSLSLTSIYLGFNLWEAIALGMSTYIIIRLSFIPLVVIDKSFLFSFFIRMSKSRDIQTNSTPSFNASD